MKAIEDVERGQRPFKFWRAFAFSQKHLLPHLDMRRNRLTLTDRDRELLVTLAQKVKLFTTSQIHRTWWEDDRSGRSIHRRLSMLEDSGLIESYSVTCHPEVPLPFPLARWDPGTPFPNLKSIAAKASCRWAHNLATTRVVTVSREAAALFAGTKRRTRPSEITHDVHLAQVFLRKRLDEPMNAAVWQCESCYASDARGKVVPDAKMGSPNRTVAIEVVGQSYSAKKLQRFCEHCKDQGWRFELW